MPPAPRGDLASSDLEGLGREVRGIEIGRRLGGAEDDQVLRRIGRNVAERVACTTSASSSRERKHTGTSNRRLSRSPLEVLLERRRR